MASSTVSNLVECRGKKYTVVSGGARWYLRLQDQSTDKNGKVNNEKFAEGILSALSPKVTLDDLGIGEMQELVDKVNEYFLT